VLEGKRIAVVVPAKDEEAFIAETLATMPAFVDDVVVIDDGSRDRTAEVARATRPAATVLSNPLSRGVGAAIAQGYRAAFDSGAHVVAVMAGDGQMHPADLERVVAPVVSDEADYVKGERFSHPDVRRIMPAARRRAGRVLAALTKAATGLPEVTDSQCGFTAIGRRAHDAVDWSRLWTGYGYPNDLLSLLAVAKMRVRQAPVRPVYRGEKSGIRARHVLVSLGLIGRAAFRRSVDRSGRGTPPSPRDAQAHPTST
jgi:dolichol-phosphate mannosyltransferase